MGNSHSRSSVAHLDSQLELNYFIVSFSICLFGIEFCGQLQGRCSFWMRPDVLRMCTATSVVNYR